MGGTLRKRVALSRRTRALASLAALSLGASPSQAQLGVDEIVIAAGLASEAPGPAWFFIIEVQGTGLTSGSVIPPAGGALPLTDVSGGGFELEFEAGPFASFAALQGSHPTGGYTLTINGNDTVTLGWNPTEPLGASGPPSLVIDAPADGATGVSPMPDVAFSLDCTNCNDLNLDLLSFAGPTFGFGQLDVGAFVNPIPFAAMESSGGETELPVGPVDAEMLAGLVDFADVSFDPPSALAPFTYIEAGVVLTDSTFSVPEPGGAVAVVTAFATLGLLGRRRTRRRRVRGPDAVREDADGDQPEPDGARRRLAHRRAMVGEDVAHLGEPLAESLRTGADDHVGLVLLPPGQQLVAKRLAAL